MARRPPRVYPKHGSLWFVDHERKWHKLCRIDAGEAALHAALAKILDAPPITGMPAAIAAFKRVYLRSLAPSSQKEHERLLDIAADEFEAFEVADVEPADVLESATNLYDGRPTAAKAYKARLSTFFRWTITKRLRTDNPCSEVWLKSPPKRDRYITDAEFTAIRGHVMTGKNGKPTPSGPIARAFIDLCYLTAQRPTDIRRLMWSQVREEEGLIAFRPSKTAGSSGARVLVRITPTIRNVLDQAKTFGGVRSVYVIRTRDGSPFTMSGIRSAWERACERACVKGATIRDLRPKALTDARRMGYAIEALQVAAAHTSVTTTEGYIKRFEEPVSPVELRLPDAAE
ncbi:MAG: tyrosine-type recombinase/integrase [Burkholderiales bacterium]|nr:tyrosine-type recombinase/integrase [Burkholderiales bacterium]